MADYKVRMEQLWQRSEQSAHARLMALWQAWIDDPVNGSWAENCLIVKLAAEVSDLSEDMRQILNDGVQTNATFGFATQRRATRRINSKTY